MGIGFPEVEHDEFGEPDQEDNAFLLLLEENARLRKLALQLSNLLGDLPSEKPSGGAK